MSSDREAMRMALEALECPAVSYPVDRKPAADALRAALERPDVPEAGFGNMEPVAWWIPKAEQFCIKQPGERPFARAWRPLYTRPPSREWKGLTEEEVATACAGLYLTDLAGPRAYDVAVARAIEAALKEKNHD